ncbi:MAG: hypothetical protein R2792_04760 [Saprospiraceae bacterium]
MIKYKHILLLFLAAFSTLPLFSQSTFECQVLDAANTPIAGLEATSDTGSKLSMTDANGYIVLETLPENIQTIYLQVPGKEPHPIQLNEGTRFIAQLDEKGHMQHKTRE